MVTEEKSILLRENRVPMAGVEPARYRYHRILSPARLPIPSHRRMQLLYHKRIHLSRKNLTKTDISMRQDWQKDRVSQFVVHTN